jgi:hypothetical protein
MLLLLKFVNLFFVSAIIDSRVMGRDYRYDDAIQVSTFSFLTLVL